MIDLFRKSVLAVFFLYIVYVYSASLWPYSAVAKEAYQWNGYGGIFVLDSLVNLIMILGNTLSFIGLLLLKDWGRRLMLGISVIYGLTIPLWGFVVVRPLENFLGYWVGTAAIVLLTISYTALSHEFQKDK